jgi:hypothetical protein
MSLGAMAVIFLILVTMGIIPIWPHSRSWGYGPCGGVGLLTVIFMVLLILTTDSDFYQYIKQASPGKGRGR